MDKNTKRFALMQLGLIVAGIVAVGYLLGTAGARADQAPVKVLPLMGMMRSGMNVTVVNLDPVSIETYGVALGTLELSYGEKCYMYAGAPFVAIGLDGQRVLVRSRVQGRYQLYDEGAPVCSGPVLFWVGYQQYLLSAEAYQKAQREKQVKESADDRDRRVIRSLLDQQSVRK